MDELESEIGDLEENQEGDASRTVDVDKVVTGEKVGNRTRVKRTTKTSNTSNKREQSIVWKFFTKVMVDGVVKGAQCNYCQTELTAGGNYGTTHLKKHAQTSCPGRHLQLTPDQTQLKFNQDAQGLDDHDLGSAHKKVEFNQDKSMKDLVHMVIMHEYPLSIVDHFGFRRFVYGLNSSFKMISRGTLKRDIMRMYEEDKKSLKALLEHNESRVAITTDMWTASNQKKGYMVVTAHFIDQQWVLRNRILRFCYVPCPHTKGVLAKVLMTSLTQYSLENKVSSVVVDNCTTNDAMMKIMLEKFEKGSLLLGGMLLHSRCSAHILNLIVQDGLDVIGSAIEKIRNCVSFWLSSPKRIENFEEACRLLNLNITKRPILDCKTRWNSTFLMLQIVLPFKDVFLRLKRLNKRMKFVVPSEEDWSLAELICEKLEIFYDTTMLFSGRKFATINLFFRSVCDIKYNLKEWVDSEIDVIRSMAEKMTEKFDKYWDDIKGQLAIASVLDPRNKMGCVKFYFDLFYDDGADVELRRIRKILDNLVDEYQGKGDEDYELLSQSSKKRVISQASKSGRNLWAQSKSAKTSTKKVDPSCEVDHYLAGAPLPEDDEFDVLEWWKKEDKYPILRTIARDILAIPVSTVASESAFSTGGRVVSPHQSRLHSNTIEALMCLQSWMTEDLKGTLGNAHGCSTVIEDSDLEDDQEVIDVIDMDLDDELDDYMDE